MAITDWARLCVTLRVFAVCGVGKRAHDPRVHAGAAGGAGLGVLHAAVAGAEAGGRDLQ
eukprot:COSAG02_NODE_1299_length_13382_cov_14.723858_2_plen_59_part_00